MSTVDKPWEKKTTYHAIVEEARPGEGTELVTQFSYFSVHYKWLKVDMRLASKRELVILF